MAAEVRRSASSIPPAAAKMRRHAAILEVVSHHPVHTQQELAAHLADRGLTVTQATVSRDIQELGLVRKSSGYGGGVFLDHVREVTQVDFVLVIRTPPGSASLVARALDEGIYPGLAGTVAGDDTIIAITHDRRAATALGGVLKHG